MFNEGAYIMISIAMCTYNGEKYIKKQLESIINQSLQPDEIIICDDNSCDGTVGVIKNVMCHWTGKWRLVVNSINLGYKKNFFKAMQLCQGDIIFLADQDDVWNVDKLRVMEKVFKLHDDVILAFHDAELVDEKLNEISPSLWKEISFNPQEFSTGDYSRLLKGNVIQGAACAFRRGLLDYAVPVPSGAIHDEWLGLSAAFNGVIYPIHLSLIKYRQTGHNQIGGTKKKNLITKVFGYTSSLKEKNKTHKSSLQRYVNMWEYIKDEYPWGKIGHNNVSDVYDFFLCRNEAIKNKELSRLPQLSEYERIYQSKSFMYKELFKDICAM